MLTGQSCGNLTVTACAQSKRYLIFQDFTGVPQFVPLTAQSLVRQMIAQGE